MPSTRPKRQHIVTSLLCCGRKSDLATVQVEFEAVLERREKLHKECDEVAETYGEYT